jgi:hypothetical protein
LGRQVTRLDVWFHPGRLSPFRRGQIRLNLGGFSEGKATLDGSERRYQVFSRGCHGVETKVSWLLMAVVDGCVERIDNFVSGGTKIITNKHKTRRQNLLHQLYRLLYFHLLPEIRCGLPKHVLTTVPSSPTFPGASSYDLTHSPSLLQDESSTP